MRRPGPAPLSTCGQGAATQMVPLFSAFANLTLNSCPRICTGHGSWEIPVGTELRGCSCLLEQTAWYLQRPCTPPPACVDHRRLTRCTSCRVIATWTLFFLAQESGLCTFSTEDSAVTGLTVRPTSATQANSAPPRAPGGGRGPGRPGGACTVLPFCGFSVALCRQEVQVLLFGTF